MQMYSYSVDLTLCVDINQHLDRVFVFVTSVIYISTINSKELGIIQVRFMSHGVEPNMERSQKFTKGGLPSSSSL